MFIDEIVSLSFSWNISNSRFKIEFKLVSSWKDLAHCLTNRLGWVKLSYLANMKACKVTWRRVKKVIHLKWFNQIGTNQEIKLRQNHNDQSMLIKMITWITPSNSMIYCFKWISYQITIDTKTQMNAKMTLFLDQKKF